MRKFVLIAVSLAITGCQGLNCRPSLKSWPNCKCQRPARVTAPCEAAQQPQACSTQTPVLAAPACQPVMACQPMVVAAPQMVASQQLALQTCQPQCVAGYQIVPGQKYRALRLGWKQLPLPCLKLDSVTTPPTLQATVHPLPAAGYYGACNVPGAYSMGTTGGCMTPAGCLPPGTVPCQMTQQNPQVQALLGQLQQTNQSQLSATDAAQARALEERARKLEERVQQLLQVLDRQDQVGAASVVPPRPTSAGSLSTPAPFFSPSAQPATAGRIHGTAVPPIEQTSGYVNAPRSVSNVEMWPHSPQNPSRRAF